MIGVQVRKNDRGNGIRVDTELAHRNQGGSAAIHQKTRRAAINEEAGIEPAA